MANFVDNRVLNVVAPPGTTQFDDRVTSMAPTSSDTLTVVAPQGTTQVEGSEHSPPTTTTTTTLHASNAAGLHATDAADSSNSLKADHKGVPIPQTPIDAEAKADANLSATNDSSSLDPGAKGIGQTNSDASNARKQSCDASTMTRQDYPQYLETSRHTTYATNRFDAGPGSRIGKLHSNPEKGTCGNKGENPLAVSATWAGATLEPRPTIYLIGENLAVLKHVCEFYGIHVGRTAPMLNFGRRNVSDDAAAMLQAIRRESPDLL